MKPTWMNLLFRALAIIPAVALLHRGYASPAADFLWWANSLRWGVAVFLLVESRRMLKFKAL